MNMFFLFLFFKKGNSEDTNFENRFNVYVCLYIYIFYLSVTDFVVMT